MIYLASALMPVAVRIWAYMASKSFMSVLQLLYITILFLTSKQTWLFAFMNTICLLYA